MPKKRKIRTQRTRRRTSVRLALSPTGELLEQRILLSTVQVGALVPSLTGSADDTSAIQSAINSSAPGDTLHFAAGTYLVSQTLTLLPNRNYVGDAGSVLQMSPSASPGTGIAQMIAGADDTVNLEGLTFNSSLVGGGIAITVNGGNSVPANNLYILDDTFINTPGTSGNPAPAYESAIYEPVGMNNSEVEGNIFLNDGGCISLANPNNTSIDSNSFNNVANSCIFVPIYNLPFTYGNGVSISGNTMTNLGGNGIELFGANGNPPDSLIIDSNTMSGFTGTQASIFGISAVTGTGTQIDFNAIQGSVIGTGIEVGGTGDAVQQNVINGFNTGITIGTTINSVVDGNLIENSASVGITKYNAGTSTGLTIENNLLVNPQSIGIWMNANDGWAGTIQTNVVLRTAGAWSADSGFIGISLIASSGVSTIDDNVVSLNATAAPSGFNFIGIENNGYVGNFAGSSIVDNVVVATGPAIGSGLYSPGQGGFNGMIVTGNTLQDVALAGGGGAAIPQTGNVAIDDGGLGYLSNGTVVSATPPVAGAVIQAVQTNPVSIYGNASAATSTDGIASYFWLFSDGSTAGGAVAIHQFNASSPSPSVYGYAALVVQDEDGAYATIAGAPTQTDGTGSQTITVTAPVSPIAFNAGETVVLNATGGGSTSPVVFSIDPTSTATGGISGNILTVTSAGTFFLDANQAGDVNFAPAPQVQLTLVVTKGNQSITFIAPASPVSLAPNETIALSAIGGGSTNPIVFSIDPASTGTGSISGKMLTVTGAGTLVLDANQAGNTNFNSASQVQQSLVVLKGTDAITFSPPPSPINYAPGETVPLIATGGGSSAPVLFSVDSASTATGNISGNVLTVTGAGTFVIDANQAGNASYFAAAQVQQTLLVARASQLITFTPPASPIAFTAGETVNFTATGGASGNTVVFSIDPSSTGTGNVSGSTLTVTTGGTFFIDAGQAGNTNYSPAPTVQQWLYVGNAAAPVVTTGFATQLSMTGATLNATVNPDASTTAVLFQLSTSSTFTPSVQTQVGSNFSGPHGVVVNAAGDVFVADTFNNQVKEIFPNGTVQLIGSGFSLPAGVAVNAAGDVFVADYGNNLVKEVLPNGTIQTVGSGFNQPFDVAVDSSGDVFVADFGNNAVKEVLPGGLIKVIGSGFSGPSSIAVDSAGDVFVADTYNSQVKEVLVSGTIKVIGSGFSGPAGVAVDSSGDVFVADSFNSTAREVLANGAIKTLGSALNSPAGIAVDGAGDVFIADTNNARVLELALPSVVATPSSLSGSTPMPVTATLTGLTAGAVYYYRAVAANAFGTTAGATTSFTAPTTNTSPATFNITSGNSAYTAAAYVATATVTGANGIDSGAVITYTYFTGPNTSGTALGLNAPINAGTYTLVASFAGDGEYTATSANETFQITPRTLTIASVTAAGKTYDGTTSESSPTIILTGVIGIDSVTATGNAAFASPVVGAETIYVTSITLGGPQASDYTVLASTSTSAIITPKTLTISSVTGKIYDGTASDPSPSLTLNGIVGSDNVAATGTATFTNTSAGTQTLNLTGITLNGSQAADYTIASNVSTTAIITPRTLTILSVSGKVYDRTTTDPIPTIVLAGVVGTDNVTASGIATFANASAGIQTLNLIGVTLSGSQAVDYTIASNVSTNAVITPKSLTISSVSGKVYDGTISDPIPTIVLVGVVGTDNVTATGTATFTNASAGIQTLNLTGVTLSGSQAADYTIASNISTNAIITSKSLTITSVTAPGKIYDGTTTETAPAIVLGGLIGTDGVTAAGSAAFFSSTAGLETVNVGGITLSGAQAGDYTVASNASTTANITPKTLTILSVSGKVYDGTITDPSPTIVLAGVVGKDSVTVTGTATFANVSAGTQTLNLTGVTLSGSQAVDYTIASNVSTTAVITPKSLTILSVSGKVYDGTTTDLSPTIILAGVVGTDNVTASGTATFANASAGTQTLNLAGVVLSGSQAGDYTIASNASTTAIITPKILTITSISAPGKIYDGTTTETAPSIIVGGVIGTDVVTAAGSASFVNSAAGLETISVAGITLSGAQAGDYTIASNASTTAIISPKTLTISSVSGKVYDGTTTDLSPTIILAGVVGTDNVMASGTATFANASAGTQTLNLTGVTLSGVQAADYTIASNASTTAVITPKTLVITSVTALGKIYDGTTTETAPAFVLGGLIGIDSVTAIATAAFVSPTAGSETVSVTGITLSGAHAADYTIASNASTTAIITPKTLTLTTVTAPGKVYNGTTDETAPTITLGGIVGTDSVTATGFALFVSSTVGTQTVNITGITLSGVQATDYTVVSNASTTAIITPKTLTITSVSAPGKIYDGTTNESAPTLALGGIVGTDSVTANGFSTFASSTAGVENVNITGITLTGAKAVDYSIAANASTTAIITPKALTIASITAAGKIYDGTTSETAPTITVNGVIGTDGVNAASGSAAFASAAAGTETVNIAGLSLSGPQAADYTIASNASTTAIITPKLLTIASVSGKVYDGTTADASPSFALVGVVGSDNVTAAGTAVFANASAGVQTLALTGISLAGVSASDYSIATNLSTTALITPKSLTILSVTAPGKSYDGTTSESAPAIVLSGMIGTDSVAATGSASFSNPSAGVETVNITGITLSGSQAGDYTIASNASTTAIITPKTLTIASISAAGKTYDGTTSESSPTFALSGVLGTDSVTAAGIALFASAAAGLETVNVTAIALSGTQANDYSIASNASTTAIITPKSLTIASVSGKVYDGTTADPSPLIVLSGVVGSDNVTVTGSAVFANASAGVQTLALTGITLGGSKAADYTIATNLSTTALITPKALTILSVTAPGKTYDGTNVESAPVIVLSGVIGTDSIAASATTGFSNSSAGSETVNVTNITLTGAQAGDYTVASNASTTAIITPKALTFTSVTAPGKVYDGTTSESAPTIVLGGVIGTDSVTAIGSAAFLSPAVGLETVNVTGITLSGPQAADYTVPLNTSTSAIITPKTLMISSVAGKIYDGTLSNGSPAIVVGSVIGSDNVTATGTAVFANASAGLQTINLAGITLSGAQAADYTIASNASTTAIITPRTLTIASVIAPGKVYDGTTSEMAATFILNGVVGTDGVTSTGSAAFVSPIAGSETVNISGILLSGPQASDYTIASNASTTAIITPKTLTITSVSGKIYDGTISDASATITLAGVVGTDSVTASGTATFANASAGIQTLNETGITLSGSQAGNYTIASNLSTSAIITPRVLTIASVTAPGKIYDGTTIESAPTIVLSGVIATDSVTANGSAAFASPAVGLETVNVTGITLGGPQAADYTVASNASTSAIITPKTLTFASVTGKIYDGTVLNGSPAIVVRGVVGSDNVTAMGTAVFANASAGLQTINLTGITLSGNQATDYTIASNASTTAIITPKTLTISSINATGKTYDGTTSASATTLVLAGLIGTDSVTAAGSASFVSATAGVEAVTLTGITLSGPQAGDYTISSTGSSTAIIAPATPVISVTDAGGVQNGLQYSATATVAGVTGIPASTLEGITPTLLYYTGLTATGVGSSTAPSAAGTYTAEALFAGSADYSSANSSPVTFTISPMVVTSTSVPTITLFPASPAPNSAVVSANVNPNGQPTTVIFQYSTSPSFTPIVQSVLGYGFSGPHGLAVNSAGDLFVADTFNNSVKEIFPDGSVKTIGSGFSLPVGVAMDSAGDVFVADYGHSAVKEVLVNGSIQTIGSGFNQPFDVAVDSSGDVFVADFGNNAVKEVLSGGAIRTIGSGFSGPSQVAVDSSGDVFVADTFNSRVKEVLASGTIKVIGSGFSGPEGVAVDSSGDVFIADSFNNQIKEVQANGTILTLASGLNAPAGIAVDGAGNVYIADTNNARVLELSPQTVNATPFSLSGSVAIGVSATLSGLTPGTAYYYRVVAYSPNGTVVANGQFATPATPGMTTSGLTTLPGVESVTRDGESSGQSPDAELLDHWFSDMTPDELPEGDA